LGLRAGGIEPATPGLASRPLPQFHSAFESTIHDRRASAWTPIATLGDPLAEIRIPGEDLDACFSRSHPLCFPEYTSSSPSAPAAPRALPTAPKPPDAGRPRTIACIPPWPPSPTAGLFACGPPAHPPPATCPIGQMQLRGQAGCATIGPPCPIGPWPMDPGPA